MIDTVLLLNTYPFSTSNKEFSNTWPRLYLENSKGKYNYCAFCFWSCSAQFGSIGVNAKLMLILLCYLIDVAKFQNYQMANVEQLHELRDLVLSSKFLSLWQIASILGKLNC